MEFFYWINVPLVFFSSFAMYFNIAFENAEQAAAFEFNNYIICLIVAAALYIVCLIFGGVGLSTMAKKRGLKNGWLAFIPFANTYYSGKFAEDCNLFGKKIKHIGLICMLAEIAFVLMSVFTLVVSLMIKSNPAFYTEKVVDVVEADATYTLFEIDTTKLTGIMRSLALASSVVSTVAGVWSFVLLFFFCVLYNSLFRKYYARSPFLMTFLCAILPCRGFVLFAVRNNTPIDYNEYMRKRMEEERRRYQSVYGQDMGGRGDGGDSPFPDFDGTKGSGRDENGPFSDFK